MTRDGAFATRCRAIRLILSDVDGVMTDGTLLLLRDGSEAKAFHARDGLGVVLAHRAGLKTGLISGRSSPEVSRRATELGMVVARQGVSDKGAVFREILAELALQPHEVAYVGDDVNDLPVLLQAGLSAAPADAAFEVRAQTFMVLDAAGGRGCLREFVESILRARGEWEGLVQGLSCHWPPAG